MTLQFPATTGRIVKIELTGAPKDVDAFGQIIEVTGKKDTAGNNDQAALRIVEIEIYEPVNSSPR